MAQHEHKLFTTPVSMNDGFKRSDSKTWATLGIVALIAVAVVVMIEVFFEKPKVRWPQSPPQAQQAVPAVPDEPRTYDVAPRESAPAKPAKPR